MSHNIYLHSSTIQSRDWAGTDAKKRELLRFEFIDTVLAMGLGWVVNSAIVLVAAAVFYNTNTKIISLEQAAATLKPLAGEFAGMVFASGKVEFSLAVTTATVIILLNILLLYQSFGGTFGI